MPAHIIIPPPPCSQCWHQQTARPHNAIYAVCHLPGIVETRVLPWRTHWRKLWCQTTFRSRPWWGQQACRWASLRRFLTVCAQILWMCKPPVSSAVRVAGLRRSHRWRSRMWRSCTSVCYTWSAIVRPVGHTAKFSKMTLEAAFSREMNIQFSGNRSGGNACSQHAKCTLPQNLRHLWHSVVWQNFTF